MQSTQTRFALAVIALALAGCAGHDRGYADRAPAQMDPRPVSTPSLQPDRQTNEPIRSFSDPGPNYPDTGR